MRMFGELRDTKIYGLRPAPVLPETIDNHLQEAAFATAARRRMLLAVDEESPDIAHLSVAAIRRQEELLRGHLAGLASVWNARLEQRLSQLLLETHELQFVAAFLLLRCARVRWEPVIRSAYQRADSAAGRDFLGEAIMLAGQQRCTFAPAHIDTVQLARAIAEQGVFLRPDTARQLARCAPQLLCTLTRAALRTQGPICQAQLNTLCAMIPTTGAAAERDFALIVAQLRHPQRTCAVLRALWLTGRAAAADIYFAVAHEHEDGHARTEAARGFELLTGLALSRSDDDADDGPIFDIDAMAPRYKEIRSLNRFAQPALNGRPRDTQTVLAMADELLLAEWHALLGLVASRSQGEVSVPTHQFFTVQKDLLIVAQQRCDQLLFVEPGAQDTGPVAHKLAQELGQGR